jgi:hypothetical protein
MTRPRVDLGLPRGDEHTKVCTCGRPTKVKVSSWHTDFKVCSYCNRIPKNFKCAPATDMREVEVFRWDYMRDHKPGEYP